MPISMQLSLIFRAPLSGSLGDTLGRITEDRLSGVAGKLGENAKIIPMYVSVTDMDRGLHQSTNVQLVTDEDLVPTLWMELRITP
mgnify:CR=1 FL=1